MVVELSAIVVVVVVIIINYHRVNIKFDNPSLESRGKDAEFVCHIFTIR